MTYTQVMLLYDVTSDRSFCAVRHWVNSIDVRVILISIMSVCLKSSFGLILYALKWEFAIG